MEEGQTSKLYERGPRKRIPFYGIFANSVNKYFSAPRCPVADAGSRLRCGTASSICSELHEVSSDQIFKERMRGNFEAG